MKSKFSFQTDRTGCGSRVIHVTEFGISSNGYFAVTCNVEETGTGESVKQMAIVQFYSSKWSNERWSFVPPGITMQGSTSAEFNRGNVNVYFEDTPDTYRPGMLFKGKVTA